MYCGLLPVYQMVGFVEFGSSPSFLCLFLTSLLTFSFPLFIFFYCGAQENGLLYEVSQ